MHVLGVNLILQVDVWADGLWSVIRSERIVDVEFRLKVVNVGGKHGVYGNL